MFVMMENTEIQGVRWLLFLVTPASLLSVALQDVALFNFLLAA